MVLLYSDGRRRGGSLLLGLAIAAFAIFSYLNSEEYNPITGETQRIALTKDQEIALGLQAAPQMSGQYGGLDGDPTAKARMESIGHDIVRKSDAGKADWKFNFHLLADRDTVNAFALPGGQIFITRALYDLLQTDGQLAGVLGHEVGHVIARHGAEHIAKQQLSQGLTGAAVVATGDYRTGQMAAVIGQLVNLRYGRSDELESDALGVRFMTQAGYHPEAMIGVMKILQKAGEGRGQPPEFFSTHPNPGNRIHQIQEAIRAQFPSGVPAGLHL